MSNSQPQEDLFSRATSSQVQEGGYQLFSFFFGPWLKLPQKHNAAFQGGSESITAPEFSDLPC